MKKVISYIVLSLMIYNLAGYYIFFAAARYIIGSDYYELSSTDDLPMSVLKFKTTNGKITDAGFNITDSDEFSYGGKLYDIIRKEVRDDYVILYCVNDKKEESLNNYLYTHLQKNLPGKKGTLGKNKLGKGYKTQFKSSNVIFKPIADCTVTEPAFSIIYLEIISPPPKFV